MNVRTGEGRRSARDTEGTSSDGAARIHLLLGPVGAGKSTFALRLAREQRAVWLNLDEWMATLFRADRPETGVMQWYAERAQRCIEQIWLLTERVLEAGTSVVLEIGLIQRPARQDFFTRLDGSGYDLTLYVVDAPRELRRERVLQRNARQGATYSMVVPPEMFELASDLWEPPDERECEGRRVVWL